MAKLMQLQFLTLCDLASITREGKLNILGIFQQIFVRQLPTRYIKFTIVGIIQGNAGDQLDLQLSIIDAEQETVMPEQKAAIQIGNGGRAQVIFEVINLPLNNTGEYTVQLKSGDELLGTTNFDVINTPAQTPQKAD